MSLHSVNKATFFIHLRQYAFVILRHQLFRLFAIFINFYRRLKNVNNLRVSSLLESFFSFIISCAILLSICLQRFGSCVSGNENNFIFNISSRKIWRKIYLNSSVWNASEKEKEKEKGRKQKMKLTNYNP